ncbi:2'-5' RNA ligase family protein [Paenibacillus sp. KN14-4R]|uniref:2'-5' RNA ligase family protein n=1 Tax=Paenibacillus sp. KN14-4R TaxID=3445773 RepID=UPI003FA09B88
MYAIELFFEAPFEQHVKNIWKELRDNNISSEMHDIIGLRPHITLAVYEDIPKFSLYLKHFTNYFQNVHEVSLKFDVLAFFPTSGTLFIDPTVTETLLRLHKEYHQEFNELMEFANQYYIPEQWDPHCTLAIKLSSDKILEGMKYCYRDFKPLRSKIIEIGVVKLEYDSNYRCLSSNTIHSKRLKPI